MSREEKNSDLLKGVSQLVPSFSQCCLIINEQALITADKYQYTKIILLK